jgi:peptidoglycan-associated lipoprotein
LLNQKVVHFAYDDSEISQSDKRVLQVHAKYLLEHPDLQLRVSGHTDSRGSREYNVALGERRAQSVEKFMQVKGVPGQRMVLVSYGKEQPVAQGNDEAAWAQNRRAELDYEDRG